MKAIKKVMRPKVIGFRVSEVERKLISKAAMKRGMPLSDFIRYVLRAELEAKP